MKLRQHRGGLAASMMTVVEIQPTIEAIADEINKAFGAFITVQADQIHVRPYGYDERIGWDVHIVTIDGHGVYGFTDGPLVDKTAQSTIIDTEI